MKIVVLDDSQTVLLTIQSLLEEIGVAEDEIRLFKNGHEALDYIEKNGADIIFSDIQMPGISGYEFVERLLELSRRFVPTLFIVSADENHGHIVKMKRIGAKRFIRKPINGHHFKHFVFPEIAKIRARRNKNESVAVTDTDAVFRLDFDNETLAERIGINVKYIPRLVQSFITETRSILEEMEAAIAATDFPKIARYAHSLKGSAGNMKFDVLYEMAKTVEYAAQAEDASFSYAKCHRKIKEGLEASYPSA